MVTRRLQGRGGREYAHHLAVRKICAENNYHYTILLSGGQMNADVSDMYRFNALYIKARGSFCRVFPVSGRGAGRLHTALGGV